MGSRPWENTGDYRYDWKGSEVLVDGGQLVGCIFNSRFLGGGRIPPSKGPREKGKAERGKSMEEARKG